MAEAGCLWLLYTGGEPFVRPDFLDIYTYAKKKGFLITLFTNAALVTPQIAGYLARWRPFSIEVTVYGATAETYDRVTGVPGSYRRFRRGIQLLLDRGLPLALKTMVLSANRHELAAMKQLARGLGVAFRFDAMLNPRIDGTPEPLALRLSPSEIVQLDLDDAGRVAEWRTFVTRFCGLPATAEESREIYSCGAGVTGFAIDPEGRMSLCVLSRFAGYDLRRGSIREGWDHLANQVRRTKLTRVTRCTACEIKALCGMCPAIAELECGDPEEPVDFLCRVARRRAEAMGIPFLETNAYEQQTVRVSEAKEAVPQA
jgi:radical SAM protein with 4Fe4S-binding SPASM domain